MHNETEPLQRYLFDAGAITIYLASIAQILPAIAAALSIVWFIIRIVESKTIQKILSRWGWDWIQEKKDDTSED